MAKISEGIQLIFDRITGKNKYVYAFLGMLCVIVYANSLDVPFYFDDYAYIVENPFIRTFAGVFDKDLMVRTPLYEDIKNCVISRPLSYLTFACNFTIHQTSVTGYHLLNIAIHLVNAYLVHALILLTHSLYLAKAPLADRTPETRVVVQRVAFLVAVLFAVHPVMTNVVTYIFQRMASLATLFYLLTMVLYARFCLAGRIAARSSWYLLSLVTCIAAIKSKEIAFTLPLMLMVYDGFFCRGTIREFAKRLAPFLVCAVVAFAVVDGGVGAGKISQSSSQPSIQQVVSFAKTSPMKYLTTQFVTNPNSTSIVSMSPMEYLFTQFRVVVTYQRMLLLPVGLNLVHDYPFYRSFSEPAVLLSFGLHLLILSSALYLFRLSGSLPATNAFMYRLAAFGIVWFYLGLAMECSIIPMDDLLLEHRMYLPAIGLLAAVVSLLILVSRRWIHGTLSVNTFFAVIIVLFSILTVHRNEQWRDPLVFWQDALAKSPNKKRIHGYIGNVYRDRGEMPKALQEYRLMLANDFRYGQDHFELGELLLENGMYKDAVEEYLTALKIRPDKLFIHARLAEVYQKLGESEKSEQARRKATAGSDTNQGQLW